jgi:tetratricopeptide (TPR) repeat protein
VTSIVGSTADQGRAGSEDSPEIAVEILRRALLLREEHEGALALMDAALVRLGYHEELREVLTRRVEVETDDGERVELLRRLASLYEDILASPEQAEQSWRRLLDIEANDVEALQRLSRAYAQGLDPEPITCSSAASRRRTMATRRRRMQLATIQRDQAKNREAEIDVLRALLSEAPTDYAMAALTGRCSPKSATRAADP